MITMTRRVMFSAVHSAWLPHLTTAQNIEVFGPMASPEPCGHNYILDVSVTGQVSAITGIVVNIKEIDRIVKQRIVQTLDRKWINRQIPAFCERPVTAETLAQHIAAELIPALPAEAPLTGVRLEQAPFNYVEWNRNDTTRTEQGLMRLTHSYEFSASHRLNSKHLSEEENSELFGKCNYVNGHGHNYILEVTVSGPVNERSGRVMDGDQLDAIVHREIIDRYDHRHFNYDIPEFSDVIPSSEVVTKVIWERLRCHIAAPARLFRVVLRETARNTFEYLGEEY